MKMFNFILVLVLAVALSACGKKRGYYMDDNATGADQVVQADTANAEPSAGESVEDLPRLDDGTAPVAQTEPMVSNPETPAPASDNEQYSQNEMTPPPSQAALSGEVGTYTVQKGDTLMKVAFNLYGDLSRWRDLFDLNKNSLNDANSLRAGMTLQYEKPSSEPAIERNGDPYLIKMGDTLGTIAEDIYAKRSKWKKLYENNRTLIHDPNKIYAGFYLYYQMTEEEKREAEEIRGTKGVPQQLGSTEGLQHQMGKEMPTGGALQSLAAPDAGAEDDQRNPSSENNQ